MNQNPGFESKPNQSLIIVLRLKTAFVVVGCLKFCKQTESILFFHSAKCLKPQQSLKRFQKADCKPRRVEESASEIY